MDLAERSQPGHRIWQNEPKSGAGSMMERPIALGNTLIATDGTDVSSAFAIHYFLGSAYGVWESWPSLSPRRWQRATARLWLPCGTSVSSTGLATRASQ
jgi:hypothetical protein